MTHPESAGSPDSTFLVERYWPGVTRPVLDAAVDRVRRVLEDPSGDGGSVTHIGTLLLDADEVVFCVFSATSREAVDAVNQRAGFPFDRIVQGTWLSRTATDARPHRRARARRGTRDAVAGLGIACALLLGGCSAGAPPSVAGPTPGGAATTSRGTPGVPAASGVAQASAPAGGGASHGAIDQCSFLTTAEIETATGQKVVRMERDSGVSHTCVWTLSRENNLINLTVHLDDPRAQKEQDFDCKVGFGLKPLAGLGDSACADEVTGGEYWLHTIRGDDRVTLHGGVYDKDNYPVKSSVWAALAQDVLTKLP